MCLEQDCDNLDEFLETFRSFVEEMTREHVTDYNEYHDGYLDALLFVRDMTEEFFD